MSQRVGAAILVSSGSVYALRGRVRGTGGETIAPWRRARRSTVASLCPYRYEWERRAQERGRRLAEEVRRLAWERSAIAARSEEREPDARTRRPSKSSSRWNGYGRSHEGRGQRRREGERETLREKSTGELVTRYTRTVSDKMSCGINDTLSASSTTLPRVCPLSASDRSRLPSTRLAMSVCLQPRSFKKLLLIIQSRFHLRS